MPICARSFSSSFPAWPTNGRPCLSSWKPGASPTNINAACGLPAPKTTCVRPRASRQRVQPATGTALTAGESTTAPGRPASPPDRDDAGAPGSALSLDRDLFSDLLAEQSPPDRRVRGDATDARDLDRHLLAVVPLQLDPRADGDDPARRSCNLVDPLRVLEPRAENRDPPLEQSLLVLRRVVLEVLGEVAVAARDRDRLDDRLALRALELCELGLELRALCAGQLLP